MTKDSSVLNIFIRYFILILLPLGNLSLFYLIFTPITLYLSFWILHLFYPAAQLMSTNSYILEGKMINLIPACIAGAAYYLLLVFNLTTPIEIKKRVKSIIFLISSFLVLNILRIVIFSILGVKSQSWFDLSHFAIWYLGSTLLVVGLWFLNVYLFKIKEYPVISDFRNILNNTKRRKR